MKFTISSNVFNSFLRRLVSVSSGDKSQITFSLDNNELKVYYESKLDKTDSISLFYEEIELLESFGSGLKSLQLNNLFTIKVPEFVSEEKFPHCRAIQFSFVGSILHISFYIRWGRSTKESLTELKFPLLQETANIENYKSLFKEHSNPITVNTKNFLAACSLINFIKSDVTSKETKGVLVSAKNKKVTFCNTDSVTAVRYILEAETEISSPVSFVAAPQILNAFSSFLNGTDQVNIHSVRNQIHLSSDKRVMMAPAMATEYIIDDPDLFFELDGQFLCNFDVRPFITAIVALVNKATDIFKKVDVSVTDGISLSTNIDKVTDLPATVSSKGKFSVDGSFLQIALQKLLVIGLDAKMYFDDSSGRITLISEDDKMMFLIQGLSNQ